MKKISKFRRALIPITIICAIGWILISLWADIDQISVAISSFKISWFFLSVIPAMASLVIATYIYCLVLLRVVPEAPPLSQVIRHFAVSQVVRHVPGKIWGVFYQANAMSHWVDAKDTVQANVIHYTLLNYNSIVVMISVFAFFHYGTIVAVGFYLTAALLLYLVLKTSFLFRMTSFIMEVLTGRGIPFDRIVGRKSNLLIVCLLQAEWVFYFLTCFIILPYSFSIEDTVVIGVCYAIAWLFGAMVLVLPSGVFIREASFLWVVGSIGFDTAEMFIFSVVARTLFTFVDILCAISMITVFRGSGRVVIT